MSIQFCPPQRPNVQAQIVVEGYEFDGAAFGVVHIKVLELDVALFGLRFDGGRSVRRLEGSHQHVSGGGRQGARARRGTVSRVSTRARLTAGLVIKFYWIVLQRNNSQRVTSNKLS